MNTNTLEQIMAVNLERVPVMCTDRHISRKTQANLARDLFKALGIKGVSVTCPRYSMAQSVDVDIAKNEAIPLDAFILDGADYRNECFSDMPDDVPAKRIQQSKNNARAKVEAILALAFPNHDDRSDTQSDHFDYCWSIS